MASSMAGAYRTLQNSYLVIAWLLWIRNPAAFGPSLLAMFGDALLPSLPASTLQTPSLIISVLYSWESGYRVVVMLPCMQHGVSHQTCHRTIFSLSWTFLMHSIAYTEIICWKEWVSWFRSLTNFVFWRIVTILRFSLANFRFRRRRRAHNRVIHLRGLLCLAIHPILRSTSSPLTMGFMEDVSLGGPLPIVSSDVDLFCREGAKTGLQLNVGKCEIIAKATFNPEGSLAGSSTMRPADAILLGASLIGLGSATDHAVEASYSDLHTAIARLKGLLIWVNIPSIYKLIIEVMIYLD